MTPEEIRAALLRASRLVERLHERWYLDAPEELTSEENKAIIAHWEFMAKMAEAEGIE